MEFIETIKIKDNKVINLDLHIERMKQTAEAFSFNMPKIPEITEVIPSCYRKGLIKCRILYDRFIRNVSFEEYRHKPIKTFKLIEDNSLKYDFKFANRQGIDVYMPRGLRNYDEVIFTRNGFITDTSYTNIVFEKDNDFFTPKTYLLNGTKRQFLLKNNMIKEAEIKVENINEYDNIILINSMLDIKNGITLPISSIKLQ